MDLESLCAAQGLSKKSFDSVFTEYLRTDQPELLFCGGNVKVPENMIKLIHDMIITNELKIRNSHLNITIRTIERLHPGLTMRFIVDELQKDPFSLPIRFRLRTILLAVVAESTDLEPFREFISRFPALAANCYDDILKILEKDYAMDEFKKRSIELGEAIAQLLKAFINRIRQ
ncbi:hypothetical protein PFISCL1PPCAC_26851 [Pristionchus fissidentatus]|uniref:Uncharacterized protein n=1 Tax=Pristionchus fissidentatus TaxID=1538716 RepID=A0AAV5WTN0_9BILA|nr:hypothetical protein PFISCL1PPCAC_26851 [Pristionchus fissidentatus]